MTAREKILSAFRATVLSKRYDEISINEIIAEAQVARSTFYQHFQNKDQLLIESLAPILDSLSKAISDEAYDENELIETLEHIWENRALGRRFFQPSNIQHISRALLASRTSYDPAYSLRVHGTLGVLGDWINGRFSASVSELLPLFRFVR